MTQQILVLGTNNVPQNYTPITASAGVTDAGKPIATGSDGLLDNSFLQVVEEQVFTAKEALFAGAFINVVNVSGTSELQLANATDATKPAVAWVPASYGPGDQAKANFSGINNFVPIGSFTATNVGEEIFLGVISGQVVARSHAFAPGNIILKLGTIVSVNPGNSTMSVEFHPELRCIA